MDGYSNLFLKFGMLLYGNVKETRVQ